MVARRWRSERRDRRHARPVGRVGAALRPVLPGDRLWRHAADRDRGPGRPRPRSWSGSRSTPTSIPKLAWSFHPVQREISLPPGEERLAFYEAVNRSDRPIVGRAVFNVTPDKIGSYFAKIECFCFQEQVLEPGQKVEMPVSFFVDPALLDGPEHARGQADHAFLHLLHGRGGDRRTHPQARAGLDQLRRAGRKRTMNGRFGHGD